MPLGENILAVRRGNAPAVVQFRQIGRTVQYSLDGVIWQDAFYLPDAGGADSPDKTIPTARANWSLNLNYYEQIKNQITVEGIQEMYPEPVPDRVCRAATIFVYHASGLATVKIPPYEYDTFDITVGRLPPGGFGNDIRFVTNLLRAVRKQGDKFVTAATTIFETSWIARELGWQVGQTEILWQDFLDSIEGVEPISGETLDEIVCLITDTMSASGAGIGAWAAIDWSALSNPNAAAYFATIWNYDLYPMFASILSDTELLTVSSAKCPCTDCREFLAQEYEFLTRGINIGAWLQDEDYLFASNNRQKEISARYRWNDNPFIVAGQKFRLTATLALQNDTVGTANTGTGNDLRFRIVPRYFINTTEVNGVTGTNVLLTTGGRVPISRFISVSMTDTPSSTIQIRAASIELIIGKLATTSPTAAQLTEYAIPRALLTSVKFCIEYL